jgi:hypothetical protein
MFVYQKCKMAENGSFLLPVTSTSFMTQISVPDRRLLSSRDERRPAECQTNATKTENRGDFFGNIPKMLIVGIRYPVQEVDEIKELLPNVTKEIIVQYSL